ncbi:MAG: CoA transferase, partial [Pseudomonadota bacterium]
MSKPLSDITVLDFGHVYNGPYCGFLLAMAGARVIKIESPRGETLRARGPLSYPFAMLNSSKDTITLNIKSERGQALLKQMVTKADVLLENFAPGTMDRIGLGADAMREINPRLVYASGSGYGKTGPNSEYLAMDLTIQAMTGVMSINGAAGDNQVGILTGTVNDQFQ